MRLSGTSGRLSLIALAVCAAASSGCVFFQSPRTYPAGEPLAVGPAMPPSQGGRFDPEDPVAVTVRPQRTIAPVGSVVILVAGVQTGDGFLRTNERLEWTMAPGSVGQFAAVQDNGWVDILLGDFNRPRIVNHALAIGSTSRESVCLNRGPPGDNLCVLRGQTWITVVSCVEGTSRVTVFAPGVVCCEHRMDEAVIEWIRPQGPVAPQPVVPVGPPKTAPAADISVHKSGPATVATGGTAAYHIEVSNPGGAVVRDVLLEDQVPDNFTYLSSTPPAELVGKRLQWRMPQLAPGQRQSVELTFRAVQEGSVANCAEVTAAGGLKASDCVSTTALPPVISLDLDIRGPEAEATVGSNVDFQIVVTNRGQVPATGLTIVDLFDAGLEVVDPVRHTELKEGPLKDKLPDLGPDQHAELQLTFRVARAGRLCHTVQVLDARGTVLATKEGWVTGVRPPGPLPGPTLGPPPGPTVPLPGRPPAQEAPNPPPAAAPSGLSVTVTGLHNAVTAGEEMTYYVRVKNGGATPEHQVVLTAAVPAAMALAPLGTSGPPSAKYAYDSHVITFTPIETLAPGQTLTYHIRVRAPRPGVFRFKVQLGSRDLAQPLQKEEVTEVLQKPRESK
jgi:uncharacterized repeat protein (TIGR01451 family)